MSNAAEHGHSYLLVRAGGDVYGIPADSVRRVLQSPTLFPVPGSEPRFAGLGQFGGEPIPVLDLAALVSGGGDGGLGATVILRMERGGPGVGLAVDEALQVAKVEARDGAAEDGGVIAGHARVDDRPVRLVDLAALLGARPPATAIEGDEHAE